MERNFEGGAIKGFFEFIFWGTMCQKFAKTREVGTFGHVKTSGF